MQYALTHFPRIKRVYASFDAHLGREIRVCHADVATVSADQFNVVDKGCRGLRGARKRHADPKGLGSGIDRQTDLETVSGRGRDGLVKHDLASGGGTDNFLEDILERDQLDLEFVKNLCNG